MAWRWIKGLWWGAALLLVALLAFAGLQLARMAYRAAAIRLENEAPSEARLLPDTDINPYGANMFLQREVEPWKIDKTLQMAAEAGLGWVKLQFPWEQLEPERKGEYLTSQTRESTWDRYDRIVAACEQYGLEIVARLDRPPAWARDDNTFQQAPPDDFRDYGDFVYAFVSHYRGRIQYIQIWNEPNIFPEWGNRPVNPEAYVEMLRIAYTRAKEADPNVRVLSAPLAFTLGEPHPDAGEWRSMNDLEYLDGMYRAGAAAYFDIYSANAFGMQYPPEEPPDPAVLNFQRVLLHREIMERYGDEGKAVWFNEYGWNAAPASMPAGELVWQRVTEQQQADYTLRGIRLAREEWPWAGAFLIWYFRQVGNIPPDSAEYYFRMVDPDFTPRQVHLAVQDATKAQQEVGLGLYQEMNAAVRRYGNWAQVFEPEANGGAMLVSEAPGDSLTFSYHGEHVDLITEVGPEGGRAQISLDGQPVPGLPRDDAGNSYISLHSEGETRSARLPLVADGDPGGHTLRITVADPAETGAAGGRIAIDAFEVLSEQEASSPVLAVAMYLGTMAVAIPLLIWVLRRLGIVTRPR
ncbi:MAG: hypothetical protein GXX94_07525 [Chloroflexi bacterium]|nr:hypothetical protein [Chloroflexota bacterium]